jgi:uncharacterized Tic20 family protein
MDYSGLILAVLIGILIAWVWQRGRKKVNFNVKGKHWFSVAIIVAIVLFLIYGASMHGAAPHK